MSWEWITSPEIWISLVSLTLLEIVLGVDNIIFISILAAKLPHEQQDKARKVGLSLALITRILLLCSLAWIVKLTAPLFHIPQLPGMEAPHPVSGRDLILLFGGLFLLAKATFEIHEKLEGEEGEKSRKVKASFANIIFQILMLDIVFSLDSVITAVGMVKQLPVMVAAVTIALAFMLVFARRISEFIESHPTLKILALSFLLLVGFVLVMEGFHKEVPKGYIYFAMAFAVGVEIINLKMRARSKKPVELHSPYTEEPPAK